MTEEEELGDYADGFEDFGEGPENLERGHVSKAEEDGKTALNTAYLVKPITTNNILLKYQVPKRRDNG